MTKTESAHLTAQTVLIESAEEALQISGAAGVRLAIPDTDALIMVGPADWIAKNVPGVEAMVAGELTDEQYQEILRPVLSRLGMHRFLNGDEITLNPSDYRAIIKRACDFTRLAATTQASTAQAEARDVLRLALDALTSCQQGGYIDVDGDFVRTFRFDVEKVGSAILALRSAGDTGSGE